jgi:hypothetical protein
MQNMDFNQPKEESELRRAPCSAMPTLPPSGPIQRAPDRGPRALGEEERVRELVEILRLGAAASEEGFCIGFACERLYTNYVFSNKGDARKPLAAPAIRKLTGRDLTIARTAHDAVLQVFI